MDKLKKLKETELKILLEFDRVCRENNIKYSIGYGTLLGAVRHKGFIPWDDDIDIMMMYDEYKKFEEIAPKKLKPEFYFQSRKRNPKNYIFWNRIGLKNTTSIDMQFSSVKADWGICIDIFPVFPVANEEKDRTKQLKALRIYNLLSFKYFHKATFKGATLKDKIKKIPHCIIPDWLNIFVSEKLINYVIKKASTNPQYCVEYSDYDKHGLYEYSWFKDFVELEFEDHKFYAIKEWDAFLTNEYGEYMKPPKSKVKHSDNPNVLIDFDKSFKEYLKK